MANKNKRQEEVSSEEAIDPITESRELEKEQSDAGVFAASDEVVTPEVDKQHIILTRENLTLIAPNVWRYKHDASLSECKVPTAFKGEMAKNFGIRPLDLIFCQNETEAPIMITVPPTKE